MNVKPSDFGGLFSCHRVVVVGANGAGKTWLALQLGDALDLPVVHNDALALTTGWGQRDREDVQAARDTYARTDHWLIEGGPSILNGFVLAHAEAAIWLDLPRNVRLDRILWRSVRYMGQQRPEHLVGNRDWPGLRQFCFALKAWRNDQIMRDTIAGALDGMTMPLFRMTSEEHTAIFLRRIAPLHQSEEI